MSSLCYFVLFLVLLCDTTSFCCTKFHKVGHKVSQCILCGSLRLLSVLCVKKSYMTFLILETF